MEIVMVTNVKKTPDKTAPSDQESFVTEIFYSISEPVAKFVLSLFRSLSCDSRPKKTPTYSTSNASSNYAASLATINMQYQNRTTMIHSVRRL